MFQNRVGLTVLDCAVRSDHTSIRPTSGSSRDQLGNQYDADLGEKRMPAKPFGLPAPDNWPSARSHFELDVVTRPWTGAGPGVGMN